MRKATTLWKRISYLYAGCIKRITANRISELKYNIITQYPKIR